MKSKKNREAARSREQTSASSSEEGVAHPVHEVRYPTCFDLLRADEVSWERHKAVSVNGVDKNVVWYAFDQTATDGVTVSFEEVGFGRVFPRVTVPRDYLVAALRRESDTTFEVVSL